LADSIAEPLHARSSRHECHELTALNNSIVLIDQLAKPSHASRATTVSCGFHHGRDDVHDVAKEDWRFETPRRDSNQGERRDTRPLDWIRPASTLSPSSPCATGSPNGEPAPRQLIGMKLVVIAGQMSKVSDIIRSDLASVAGPAIARMQIFEVKRFVQSFSYRI
jgi:hypothetical protein